jgi:hypothetical protein
MASPATRGLGLGTDGCREAEVAARNTRYAGATNFMTRFHSIARFSICVALACLAGCSGPAPKPTPQTASSNAGKQREIFATCDSESFLSLAIARNYFLSGRKEDQVLVYVANKEPGFGLAQKLFREVSAGSIGDYSAFTTETLFACAQRESMQLDKPRELVKLCFARVDIPFFLSAWRHEGIVRNEATNKARSVLKNRTIYPDELISATAEAVYADKPDSDGRKIMGTVFWSCVYKEEWQRKS